MKTVLILLASLVLWLDLAAKEQGWFLPIVGMAISFNYKGAISGNILPDFLSLTLNGFGAAGCGATCAGCGGLNGTYLLTKVNNSVDLCFPDYVYSSDSVSITVYRYYGAWELDAIWWADDTFEMGGFFGDLTFDEGEDSCQFSGYFDGGGFCYCSHDEDNDTCGDINLGYTTQSATAQISEVT
ncbi:hypothetical protein CCP3SC15_3400003 [Gammaproteobacteria bacterium]